VPWARSGADFTLLFESFAMTLCRQMPVNAASRIIGEDDNKLWRMVRYYVGEAKRYDDLSRLSSIGVDETSARKGHDYVTLVVDLEQRKTIFVAQGKDASTMGAFREYLAGHRGLPGNIISASIDMSPAFIKGMADTFPGAEVTFDRFHIMKIVNNAVDEVRKKEIREQDILRGTRYIWLKNRQNLTVAQEKTLHTIESMPRQNMKTVRALHIRENFQLVYKESTQESFERMLKKWYFWATHSRIPPIIEAARTIRSHWSGVVSWYKNRIDNGILEGLNSLIQAAKAKARGYRTFENFRAIIYLVTGKLDFSKTGLPT